VKRKSNFLVIVIFVSLCSIFTHNVYGNPIVAPPLELTKNPFFTVPLLILMFFVGARVEHAYFNSKILKKNSFNYVPKSQYRTFLKINIVTFPLTQILAYFFSVYFVQFFWLYILLIEIGVVFIESYLLKIELTRVVDVKIPSKSILIRTFFANAFSFLIGFFLAYLPLTFL